MGIIRRLIEKFTSPPLNLELTRRLQGYVGPNEVNEVTAFNLVPVFACIRAIAEDTASMPFPVYEHLSTGGKRKDRNHPVYKLLNESPDDVIPAMQWREAGAAHLKSWGNWYNEIEWTNGGDVKALHILAPWKVTPKRQDDGSVLYFVTGTDEPIKARSMLHIAEMGDGLIGWSPIKKASKALSLTYATEAFGEAYFRNGSRPGGIITHPKKLTKEAKSNLLEGMAEVHGGPDNFGKWMVLEENVTVESMPVDNDAAQFLGTRKFQLSEICRIFRIPAHIVQDLDKATFSNIEQQSIEYVTHTLRPMCCRIESEINRKLFKNEPDHFAEHLVDGLLRGDITSRYAAYAVARINGWMCADDIAELENMNPLPNGLGQIYLAQSNMANLASFLKPAEPKAPPDPQNDEQPEPDNGPEPEIKPDTTDEKELDDEAAAEPDQNAAFAVRDCLIESVDRMVRLEANAVARAAKKPNEFLDTIDEFYTGHKATVMQAIAPSVRAYCAVADPQADVLLSLTALAGRMTAGKEELLELSGKVSADELPQAVEKTLSNWRRSKAKEIVAGLAT